MLLSKEAKGKWDEQSPCATTSDGALLFYGGEMFPAGAKSLIRALWIVAYR